VRARSESFFDHFSQAALFFNSQSVPEQDHMVKALRFELGKVETEAIRERMVFILSLVDATLAARVAAGLGIDVPSQIEGPLNRSIPADGDPAKFQPLVVRKKKAGKKEVVTSPALSMANTVKGAKTRKVAILAADGFGADLATVKKALLGAGVQAKIVAPRLGMLNGADGQQVKIDFSFLTSASVLFDAVYVAGGEQSAAALKLEPAAIHFVNEAYKHCKAIAATGAGSELLDASYLGGLEPGGKQVQAEEGIVVGGDAQAGKVAAAFIEAIAQHRFWSREKMDQVPA
jgi:catalase